MRVEQLEARFLLAADVFEINNTPQLATDIGIAPGVHSPLLSIHQADDEDWFKVEVLRADYLQLQLEFSAANGNLSFEVYPSVNGLPDSTPVTASSPNGAGAGALPPILAAGTYFIHVVGGGSINDYRLAIDPAPSSSTRVFYVNDTSTANDFYTSAPGDSLNTGLSPDSPKASIQQVLDNYLIGPNDLVLLDTGTYGDAVTITALDEGASYVGSPGGSLLTATFEMADADFNTLYRLKFGGSGSGVHIHETCRAYLIFAALARERSGAIGLLNQSKIARAQCVGGKS